MNIEILKKAGLSDKEALLYFEILRLGPSSVRKLAEKTDMNRGTVYEVLKNLKERGLVNFYEKDTKQFFVAENPSRLLDMAARQISELQDAENNIQKMIPELKSLYDKGGERPVARYYEREEIAQILEDVLSVCESTEEKTYRVYSTAGLREHIYESFPNFSDVRVAKGIKVLAIAIGAGGDLRGLDERKWLDAKVDTPTYIFIYPGKTAYISLNAQDEPVGVVIENEGVHQTQKGIFDSLWTKI